jgi:hypothetical protein
VKASLTAGSFCVACRPSQAQSEEARRREAVRAQLEQITQEYKQAQEQARSALKELK